MNCQSVSGWFDHSCFTDGHSCNETMGFFKPLGKSFCYGLDDSLYRNDPYDRAGLTWKGIFGDDYRLKKLKKEWLEEDDG